MNTKLFYAVARTVHQRDEDKVVNNRLSPIFLTEKERDVWIETVSGTCFNVDENGVKHFKGDITELSFQYREDVLDTEDMEEHTPVFQVTLEIVERKTIEVEITGEADEDDACEVARENWKMGEYDWMLDDIEPYDSDIEDAMAEEM